MSKNKAETKKLWIKIIAVALCALMVGSVFGSLITYLIWLL